VTHEDIVNARTEMMAALAPFIERGADLDALAKVIDDVAQAETQLADLRAKHAELLAKVSVPLPRVTSEPPAKPKRSRR
jgi:hypothetical protein